MDLVRSTREADLLRKTKTPYHRELAEFASFLEQTGKPIGPEAIEDYLGSLRQRKRVTPTGAKVSYSASWYNQRVKAVKAAARWVLDHWPASWPQLTAEERAEAREYLSRLRMAKPKVGIGKGERVPTKKEIDLAVSRADRRLALIIRFLEQSGARISEALGAEVGRARREVRRTFIEVVGKGGKARDLKIETWLFDEIRATFQGRHYLFEHDGRPYSRVATTTRIRDLFEKATGKAVSAHMLRHYRGTRLSDELGISKASKELGIKVSTCGAYYDHTTVSEGEWFRAL